MKREKGSILMVGADRGEQLLIKEVFRELRIPDLLYIVRDGEEAIDFLKGEGGYADRKKFKFPTILLTELRMPKIDGFDLLLFIKRSNLIIIPTIVLTSSSDVDDVNRAYLLGANAFHNKPVELEGLLMVLKNIYDYWARVEIPDVDENGVVKPVSMKKIHPVIGRKKASETVKDI